MAVMLELDGRLAVVQVPPPSVVLAYLYVPDWYQEMKMIFELDGATAIWEMLLLPVRVEEIFVHALPRFVDL